MTSLGFSTRVARHVPLVEEVPYSSWAPDFTTNL